MSRNAERNRNIPAPAVEKNSWGTVIVFTALSSVMPTGGGSRMSEYIKAVTAFRASMALVREMLKRGIVSEKEYREISILLAQKHGLDPQTIFSETP